MNGALAVDEATLIPLERVEALLRDQLKAAQEPGESPVIRARMSNLVIYCDRPEVAETVAAAVPAIVAVHPARVLLLLPEGAPATAEVMASLRVQCHRLGNTYVCSELVVLHARPQTVDRLPFAVRNLMIGDLPTNLWWASPQPPPLAGTLLYELTEYAQQLIYDSQGWLDPHRAVAATAPWLARFERPPDHARWRVASDLNWRRLKFWRRLLSQALDPMATPRAAESVTEVLVEHGPHAVTQAWELVGWMAASQGWKVQGSRVQPGVEISWQVNTAHGRLNVRIHRLPEGPSEVRRVRIACKLDNKPAALNCVVEDERRLSVQPEGIEAAARTVTMQRPTLSELISRQLSDREPDPVFRESMAVAQVFAQSVL
jgi:glucose-6-phosphate dehydrogenase assembly protein OpcA